MLVQQMLEIGAEFAGYRIDDLLTRGGMSEVYLAENPRLGSKVVVKLLSSELAEEETFRERFVRESRVAASLNHPNVIPIYDAGEVDGLPYIAMRYIEGPDLKELVRREGPLPTARALSIVGQVAGALDRAHARALIHRDVKPANILIDEQDEDHSSDHVYLTDFGVAKHRLSHSGLTSTGQFVGTIDYVSPEQIEGKTVDARTDVYSLGCVLYEALTGVPPFERESNAAMIYAHLLEPAPAVSDKRPELGPALDAVVAKALAKSPDDRYASCRELVKAARAAIGTEEQRATVAAGSSTVAAPGVGAQALESFSLAPLESTSAADPREQAGLSATTAAAQTVISQPRETVAGPPRFSGGPPEASPQFAPPAWQEPRRKRWLSKRVLVATAVVALAAAAAAAGQTLMTPFSDNSPSKSKPGAGAPDSGPGGTARAPGGIQIYKGSGESSTGNPGRNVRRAKALKRVKAEKKARQQAERRRAVTARQRAAERRRQQAAALAQARQRARARAAASARQRASSAQQSAQQRAEALRRQAERCRALARKHLPCR